MLKSVIDAGYNSFRLCIYDLYSNDTFRVRKSVKEFVRIGSDLDHSPRLTEQKMNEAVQVLSKFASLMEASGATDVVAVGTSAFRYASNSHRLIERIRSETGIEIKIVSGSDEGKFAALGTINTLPIIDAIVFDIGGGSLELATVIAGKIKKVKEYPLGALRLTKFEGSEKKLRKEIRSGLDDFDFPQDMSLVGTGGNVRAIAEYDLASRSYPMLSIHGYSIASERIYRYSKELFFMSQKERSKIVGISKERGRTVHTAAVAVDELMKLSAQKNLIISSYGMREGLLTGKPMQRKNLRKNWLENISTNLNIPAQFDVYNGIMEREDKYGRIAPYLASAAFIATAMKEFGFLNPYEMGFRFVRHSIMPGFTSRETLLIAAIILSVKQKVNTYVLRFLSDEFTQRDIMKASRTMKSIINGNNEVW